MAILAGELGGCRWLDLCGGSGVMACEALQRGAAAAVVVEQDRRVAAVARRNVETVAGALAQAGVEPPQVSVEEREALRFLRRGVAASGLAPFDLIYADPPWAARLHEPLAEAVAGGGWLAPGGTLIWEARRGTVATLPEGWRERLRRTYGATELVLLEPLPSPAPRRTAEGFEPWVRSKSIRKRLRDR
jgi:16S rRNA (guanine966-N2)-methyltransferase